MEVKDKEVLVTGDTKLFYLKQNKGKVRKIVVSTIPLTGEME